MKNRILTFSGSIISGISLLVGSFLIGEKWFLNNKPSIDAIILLLISAIIILYPLINTLRYEESDFGFILNPSQKVKTLSRVIAVILLILSILNLIICLWKPKNERGDAIIYEFGLTFALFISWSCLAAYFFGVRVLFSERFLEVSRHPIYLFRSDLLNRKLRRKMRQKKSTLNEN